MSGRSDYQKVYNDWVAGLSEDDRTKLREQGLDKPDDGVSYGRVSSDVILAKSGRDFDYDAVDESASDDGHGMAVSMVAWVMGRLQAAKTPKDADIDRDALIVALGMNILEGKTQTQIAQSYGMTKAAFSFRVKKWQRLLGLKPSCLMKSERACRAYRRARLKNIKGKL